jgi:hypothetical protein
MNPNPISLALVVVLAGLGVLAILGGYVVPGAALLAAAVIVFAALKMAQHGSGPSSCEPENSSR